METSNLVEKRKRAISTAIANLIAADKEPTDGRVAKRTAIKTEEVCLLRAEMGCPYQEYKPVAIVEEAPKQHPETFLRCITSEDRQAGVVPTTDVIIARSGISDPRLPGVLDAQRAAWEEAGRPGW